MAMKRTAMPGRIGGVREAVAKSIRQGSATERPAYLEGAELSSWLFCGPWLAQIFGGG